MQLDAEKFIFRNEREQQRIEKSILRKLEVNRIVSFHDLCRSAKTSTQSTRSILETMIESHLIQRLRPVEYSGEAYDYYELLNTDKSRPSVKPSKD